jgi:hypothetical protein
MAGAARTLSPEPQPLHLLVLSAMIEPAPAQSTGAVNQAAMNEAMPLDIRVVCERLGGKDEREVQRSLYILEGQKFVTPIPEGNFTSRIWCATKEGIRFARRYALETLTARTGSAKAAPTKSK